MTSPTTPRELLTIEDIKKAALSIQKMESKSLPKGIGWFTKIMAKFGWHRKYELIVFDKEQFKPSYLYSPKIKL